MWECLRGYFPCTSYLTKFKIMDREDGEMSDDNAMVVDDAKEPISFDKDCEVVSLVYPLV